MATKKPKKSTSEPGWSAEVSALYRALSDKHRAFVLAYLGSGRSAESYRKVFPLCGKASARTSAHTVLTRPDVRAFLEAYRGDEAVRLQDDRERIRATYRDALEAQDHIVGNGQIIKVVPDHKARIAGAQALAKLDGHDQPTEIKLTAAEELRALWSAAKGTK